MATVEIPVSDDGAPHFSQTVDLDGALYSLRFQWSKRESVWYMHLYDELDEIEIEAGVKLVPDYPLLFLRLPGTLISLLPGGLTGTREDLSNQRLLYVEAADLALVFSG